MAISVPALNRAVLDRQLLLERAAVGVDEAVGRVVALQAQSPASPYLALWNRVEGFEASELDGAFARRSIVKATAMRITLHAIRADEYRVFREAMEPTLRSARLDGRFTESGRTPADADALVSDLQLFAGEVRTVPEIEAWLGERFGEPPTSGVMRGVRGYVPMWHAPTGGPWSFGPRTSFVAPASLPVLGDETAASSLQVLVRRYLEGFGPGSVADIAQFALVPRARVKVAVSTLGDELERLDGPGGVTLVDVPGGSRPDEDTPAPPRLMAMWDSVLLAHHDRSRFIPPEYRALVTRSNGDVLPTLLVDGRVAGVWRTVDDGIEATAFHRLPRGTWDALEREAADLAAFLADRDPHVYRRYDHWWKDMPGAQVRVLAG